MDNLELQMLLDELYTESFLESIEMIYEKESEYKKSSFYKQTKIPLIQLYEKYFQYRMLNYSMQEKFNDFIKEIDAKQIIDKCKIGFTYEEANHDEDYPLMYEFLKHLVKIDQVNVTKNGKNQCNDYDYKTITDILHKLIIKFKNDL
jgi:hypothetical protein